MAKSRGRNLLFPPTGVGHIVRRAHAYLIAHACSGISNDRFRAGMSITLIDASHPVLQLSAPGLRGVGRFPRSPAAAATRSRRLLPLGVGTSWCGHDRVE